MGKFLKILILVILIFVATNFVLQTISYSFYKNAKPMEGLKYDPTFIKYNENLSGYGINLDSESDYLILFFGGSNYIAYNSVGRFGGNFSTTFLAGDFYGSQASKGTMNLKSMKKTAIDLYDWTIKNFPNKKIVIMGHSYGTGIATYLASVRDCHSLFLFSAYRDISDLYNKIVPVFFGPVKLFITNNIELKEYAKKVNCKTYIIGSDMDKTLSSNLQRKVGEYFTDSEVIIFDKINHEDYLDNPKVLEFINNKLDI